MAEKNQIEHQALIIWQRLRWQQRAGTVLKILLLATSILLILAVITRFFSIDQLYIWLIINGITIILLRCSKNLFQSKAEHLIHYLNHRYQWLEFSTQLIPISPEHTLQQLQRERILQVLVEKQKEVKAWPDLRLFWIAFAAVLVLYTSSRFMPNLRQSSQPEAIKQATIPVVPENITTILPAITSLTIAIKPPGYTRQKDWFAQELSIQAPEGSVITWKCLLNAAVDSMQVIWNGTDTVLVPHTDAWKYEWKKQLTTSLFYQFRYGSQGNWYTSPVYTLHAIDDQPPVIQVLAPEPYTFVLYGQKTQLPVVLQLTDDYGLNKAHLVATVSRGSGESVKFREAVLAFAGNISGKQKATLQKELDFASLHMEPGDELYFFAEAWDQANPAQKSRSDTYFIQWEDTVSQKTTVMAGISLDNMPAYFRSQRQIIIDTEKLIREQKTLDKTSFKERSNDLGVDQKVLRLRYGQFLGEEFEIATGGAPPSEELHQQEGAEEDHAKEKSDSGLENMHAHEEEESVTTFGQPGTMLEGYQHRHDTEEAATLFDETIKAQLKAALAQMWEAELRLRTLRPKEALPYEYKALELIKAIQQKSRVYVERVGFEPPPLKPAEKRLTGELEEVLDPERTWDAQAVERAYPHLRHTVAILEKIRSSPDYTLSVEDSRQLEAGSRELATIVLQQPGTGIQALNKLRNIISGEKLNSISIIRLQQQISELLPQANRNPGKQISSTAPELDLFIQELKK